MTPLQTDATALAEKSGLFDRKGGVPVAFDGCAGFLHPARGNVGVLMISPWGFEEFTIRQGWRRLAETLAAAGFACLRFDLPGTGDSLGQNSDIIDVNSWLSAIEKAAQFLRENTGIKHLVVLGQGLGALLGVEMVEKIGAKALIALAPMPRGRSGVRELELWGAMVASALRIPVELDANDALNIGGFRLSKPLVEGLKGLKPESAGFESVTSALVLTRENRPSDADFVASLVARGVDVTVRSFEGYDAFVAHLETPRAPVDDFAKISAWLEQQFPERGKKESRVLPVDGAVLRREQDGFSEEAICFGPNNLLYGVLCLPQGARRATVVIPNSGYNPHVGWARGHVALARRLASIGIASLRMDCASLGDSDTAPDSLADVLYSQMQIDDVTQAIDMVCARQAGPVIVAGRCSGAYIAGLAAESDARISGLVSINALRLIWNPDETLEQAMAGGSGSLGSYGARALSRDTLVKLVTFQLPVVSLARKVAAKMAAKLNSKLVGFTGDLTLLGRLRGKVRARFFGFEQRRVQVGLVYAQGDGGLDELAKYCGGGGAWLARFSNVTLRTVDDADHNMTAAHAQNAIFEEIAKVIQRVETLNPK